MYNKSIRGKPLLIVANKQDLDQSVDVVDITYFFRIDEICNLLGTPCLIITSGMTDRMDLKNGMDWLMENIIENYKTLKNRMRFNGILSPIKRFKRQRTSVPKQVCSYLRVESFDHAAFYLKLCFELELFRNFFSAYSSTTWPAHTIGSICVCCLTTSSESKWSYIKCNKTH